VTLAKDKVCLSSTPKQFGSWRTCSTCQRKKDPAARGTLACGTSNTPAGVQVARGPLPAEMLAA
jgi:hypothetical protein